MEEKEAIAEMEEEGLVKLKSSAYVQRVKLTECTDLLERMDDILLRDEILKSRLVQVKKLRNFKTTFNLTNKADFMP